MSNKVLIPNRFEKALVVSISLEMLSELPFIQNSKRYNYKSEMMKSIRRLEKEVRKDLSKEELEDVKKYLWGRYREGNILKLIHDSYVEILQENLKEN